MTLEIDNEDSWISILKENYGYDHFKSFSEIYYNQTENQSLSQDIKFGSIEFECAINSNFLVSRECRSLGYADFNGCTSSFDGSLSYPNSQGKYKIQKKGDCTCDNSCENNFYVKLQNEEKQLLRSRKPDHEITELIISKVRFNELMKITKLFYEKGDLMVDYKVNTDSITSAHVHFSFSNQEALLKIASPNFYRFYLDSLDYTSVVLKLNRLHNYYRRANGFNQWCKRSRNYENQITCNSHDNARYNQLNYCQNNRIYSDMGNRVNLNTLENRQFMAFRDLENTQTALRIYHNTINKFLEFYQNVSVNDLMTKDLYLRMDNKAHRFKELIVPNASNSRYDLNDKVRINSDMNNISLREIRDQQITGDM